MATDEYGAEADARNQAKADATLNEYCNDRDKATDDGGAAYPIQCYGCTVVDGQRYCDCGSGANGMTLLDHFAGLAMQALMGACDRAPDAGQATELQSMVPGVAYEIAAAMVEEKRRHEKETTP